jgi:DNA invertase Pin-like site-specific DNA recombinase/peptidoglycan hydrolase-like protein with peptidoglycan-binding domain
MTIHLFAPGNRATSITTVAILGVLAVLLAAPDPACAAGVRPTPLLAQGAGMGAHPSAQVRIVQRALQRRGYDLGAPGVDGRFGALTGAAVRQMQVDYGLAVDGVVGRHTRKALRLTGHTVRHTQRRSHAEHRSKVARERRPAAPQLLPGRTSTEVKASPDASMELRDRSGGWFASFLAGALGGLITVLLATAAVAASRRQGDRARGTRTTSKPLADETVPGSDDEAARSQATQLADNGRGEAHVSASGAAVDPGRSCLPPGRRVIGYVTVSADSGIGKDDGSSTAIKAMCERSGWELLEIVRDREVGPTLERPALGYALDRIAHRQADGLVVSDLQRLSRSIGDLGTLMAWFRRARATLVALDLGIDTSTRKGRHVASTLIALSNHAHRRTAHRSRNGLTEVNADRRTGRPAVRHDPELLERIAAMRATGMTLQAIADQLNAEGVPTLRGGMKWRPSSIQPALGYRRPGPRDHLPSLNERSVRT